jgi:glutamyl-tRNA reductase
MDAERLAHSLASLHAAGLAEVVILSTCNRLEVYVTSADSTSAAETVIAHLANTLGGMTEQVRPHLYIKDEREAAGHLTRVAMGLESLVLGETQILGQIVTSLEAAQQAGTVGATLSRLFSTALHAGKRARTETAISQHTLSISHTAVMLVEQELGEMAHARALVLGSGEMASLAATALHARGARQIQIVARRAEPAAALAARVGGHARPWADLRSAVREADVVIAATAAHEPVLLADHLAGRDDAPLVLIDIGVPRNIEPAASAMAQVRLYDIDALQSVVEEHHRLRKSELRHVEAIGAAEVTSYLVWLRSRRVVPVIMDLRQHADDIAEAEVARALHKLPNLDAHERAVIAEMANRIAHKLVHEPTVALKARALRGDHFDYAHAARKLFALPGHEGLPPKTQDDDD